MSGSVAHERLRDRHETGSTLMIGLSVAIGRFVEALFWAILRVAGTVTAAVAAGLLVLVVAAALARRAWRKERR